MKALSKTIEVIDGQAIEQIRLINDNGIIVSLLTLGATWQEFLVPTEEGSYKNLVIGFDQPSDYLTNGLCAGQTIGRVAGRIRGGQFELDGTIVQVPQNENGNCLHGGYSGFHRQLWSYELLTEPKKASVTFFYRAEEAIDGFPGDLDISVTYTLTKDNKVYIDFKGENATTKTLFNPTNHVYFNLGTTQDLADHDFYLNSRIILETHSDLIPTGQMIAVDGTSYDFRLEKNLGEAICENQGFDTAFLTESSLDIENGHLILNGDEGIRFYSNRNAWVVYTMGGIPSGIYPSRDNGKEAIEYEAIALEAQFLPDAINNEGFGDITISPNEKKQYRICFEYFKS